MQDFANISVLTLFNEIYFTQYLHALTLGHQNYLTIEQLTEKVLLKNYDITRILSSFHHLIMNVRIYYPVGLKGCMENTIWRRWFKYFNIPSTEGSEFWSWLVPLFPADPYGLISLKMFRLVWVTFWNNWMTSKSESFALFCIYVIQQFRSKPKSQKKAQRFDKV